jgi:predicted dehydrogenase
MATYRAAIIGTGRIGSLLERDPLRAKPHSHAGWYRQHPDVVLVGGADIDEQHLAAFGSDWDIPRAGLFTDYRVMLERLRPDLVSICAYAPERLEMIQAAIAAGARGLWIEKAVVCTLQEAGILERDLLCSGVKAIVDHPRRADPAYRAVKRMIDERTLGTLLNVTCMMSGSLIHTGTHAYDMLHFWCGNLKGAIGWLEKPVSRSRPIADCGGTGHMIFEGGAHACIVAGTRNYYIFQFDLAFTRGRIQLGNDVQRVLIPGPSRLYSGFEELFETSEYSLNDPYSYPMVYDLIHALKTGDEPLMTIANAIHAFKMGLALFQSDLEGHRFVTPEELDSSLRIDSI